MGGGEGGVNFTKNYSKSIFIQNYYLRGLFLSKKSYILKEKQIFHKHSGTPCACRSNMVKINDFH